jgi:Mg-chelatase subunit ChlD
MTRHTITITLASALLTVCASAAGAAPAKSAQARAVPVPKIDMVFALDTTGSMSDEIALVRRLVWDLANGVVTGKPRPSLRLGLVRYRDTRDVYVVKVTPLTFDLDAVHKELMRTRASGGGDTPEHVSLGLHKAITQKWRKDAQRMVFLIGDAKPKRYGDYYHDKEARRARALKVKVHVVGCSGLGADGVKIFKEIAQLSRGTYAPLQRTSSRRGSASDIRLRNLILGKAGLSKYASAAPPRPAPAPPRAAAPVARKVPAAPASKDPRDKGYAPTPDRIWRTSIR